MVPFFFVKLFMREINFSWHVRFFLYSILKKIFEKCFGNSLILAYSIQTLKTWPEYLIENTFSPNNQTTNTKITIMWLSKHNINHIQ